MMAEELAASPTSKEPQLRILIEAARDQGATTCVLDLLERHSHFPTTFELERRQAGLHIKLRLPINAEAAKPLLNVLRTVPGVRRVSAEGGAE